MIKRIQSISVIFLCFAVAVSLSACSADDGIIIEELDSFAGIHYEEESITTAVQETTTDKKTEITSETTVTETETVSDSTAAAETQTQHSEDTEGRTVYITPSGKRYHYSSTCGGKNSYSVSINNVGDRTPCKKCAQ